MGSVFDRTEVASVGGMIIDHDQPRHAGTALSIEPESTIRDLRHPRLIRSVLPSTISRSWARLPALADRCRENRADHRISPRPSRPAAKQMNIAGGLTRWLKA
jgi:hypothetical protein